MKRIIKAFGYSWEGLCAAFSTEAAFRQETLLLAVAIPVALLVQVSSAERAILIGSVFLVLIIELLNSAIEAVVNRISSDLHELSKRAKDIGSAAVFLSLVNAGCMWIIILGHL